MNDKVILTAFSDEKVISRKEITLLSYYEELHPEFDDADYSKQHHITMVELHIYADHNDTLVRNHYNENGELYWYEKWENGSYESEEV